MNLVIMRHGEAEMFANNDAARNLTNRGQLQAQAAGECLQQLGFIPDQCWLSPYQRTRQTAAAVLNAFSDVPQHVFDWLTPDNHPEKVIELLARDDVKNLLLISHQPLVGGLVSLLVDSSANPQGNYPMAPASMVMLQTQSLLAGCCQLQWLRHAPLFEVGG